MSSRRAADDAPTGQPEAKKPKTGGMDIAAIRAQLAAKKAAVEAKLSGGGASLNAAPAAAPAPATNGNSTVNSNGGGLSDRRDADDRRRDDERDRDRDRFGPGASGRERERDNGYGGDRDRRDRDRGYERDRRDDRDRDRDRERERDRGYDRDSRRDDRYRSDDRDRDRRDYRDDRNRNRDRDGRDYSRDRPSDRDRNDRAPATAVPIQSATSTSPAPPTVGPAAPPLKADMSVQDRVAAVKARIDAMNAKNANPYLTSSAARPGSSSSPSATAAASSSSAAPLPALSSSIALHPLLMGDTASTGAQADKNEKKALRDRYKTMAPKFSTVRANQAAAAEAAAAQKAKEEELAKAKRTLVPSLNPYASARPAAAAGDGAAPEEGARVRDRRKRQLQFARPGRYVEQGDQLRNEAKMEALKARIAEASKKAGLEGEFDTLEKSLKRQPPPDVEWWDKAILPDGTTYDKLDETMAFLETNQDSLITHLVQHPIPIVAVGDKKAPERGLMLTKKEAKKLRRQRRMAELEDKRDRQKMGLLPPDAPKVRLANLMKVLTSDAVQDPTKVEAKVRREVRERAEKHEQDNADRKLTAEERKEKEYQSMLARERKGLYAAVFKIKYLSNGQHKFKVRETAKKDLLSGICLFGKDYAIVVVEGVDKSVKHYKKLMLSRIDWTEQARARPGQGGSDEEADSDDEGKNDGDLADNKCEMIWEGEVPERSFKLFRARHAETDTKAKEWLGGKWEGMWDLAKRWAWQGEEM